MSLKAALMVSSLAAAGMLVGSSGEATLASGARPEPAAYHPRIPPQGRRAYFGELHLHTTMSFDAWAFGTRVTPDQAYKFARGQTVMVPASQVAQEQGLSPNADVPARRAWPLDFTAVTDHAEYLGAMNELDKPNSDFSRTSIGSALKSGGTAAFFKAAAAIFGGADPQAKADFEAAARAADGWAVEVNAANANYQPGTFTTFVAYEWTANSGYGNHMHRNVIFNSDHAPTPFSAVDSNRPEDLWKYLESVRRQGIDVLAIPHSSNLSDGHDFDWNMSDGKPIDAAYAMERALNEPLVEIAQIKGSSDTTPQLSPNDEFANFEIMDKIFRGETAARQNGSYVRQAYGRGLVIQSQVGVNPFKMGVVGGSDLHNGLSTSSEDNVMGGEYAIDPKTMQPSPAFARAALDMNGLSKTIRPDGAREYDPLQWSSAGLTGVWAEENTRESIFAALKRKETFGTSGTRIRVRMFGGWDFDTGLVRRPDWVAQAYRTGVSMGSDLPTPPSGARAPRFLLQAEKDPDGANLDRIQIIKIWLDGSTYREKVFDVALSGARRDDPKTDRAPLVGNTVNLQTGTYTNTIGAATLTGEWRDPEFDPSRPALYYARVLEIPTPRWTTLLALRHHLPVPARVPATLQERAWTSPIWFNPTPSPSTQARWRAAPARS